MKQFVKVLNKEEQCSQYIMCQFPQLSDAKLKEGIFNGLQIRKLLKDDVFVTKMTLTKKKAWLDYKKVLQQFLGIVKSTDWEE